jgi:hypothetical protein
MVKIDLGNTYELTSAFLGRENTLFSYLNAMEKSIEEKLDYYLRMAERSAGQKPKPSSPSMPDSLSTVIRTKEDAVLFMAQLDALTKLAHEEYLERKENARIVKQNREKRSKEDGTM